MFEGISAGVIAGGIVLLVIVLVILTIARLIVIVPPNMAAAITGRNRVLEDGGSVGYRTVTGGRTIRI
ncbi:MAG: flotillin, partial [Longimicrobiales bacterium]